MERARKHVRLRAASMLGLEVAPQDRPKPLADFGVMHEPEVAFALWDTYRDTEGVVMERGGGYLDQSEAFHQSVAILDIVFSEEYRELDAWLQKQLPQNQRREPRKVLPPFKSKLPPKRGRR